MTKPTERTCSGILIVDDKPMNMTLLGKMLKEEGYNVLPASNGEEALALLQTNAVKLILLDIRMPGMDGYAVCDKIKSDARTRDIPVIFISALNETFDKLKAFSAGGVDYITKPFVTKEVLARVRTQLCLVDERVRLRRLADVAFEGILVHSK